MQSSTARRRPSVSTARPASARAHSFDAFSVSSPRAPASSCSPVAATKTNRCLTRRSTGLIDDSSRYLSSIPRHDVDDLMPPDVAALTRVFPVMLQVQAIASAHADRGLGSADPLGLRRRAFKALRELLERLARRQPLVIWVDDLQWADADSVVLLEDLLRPPGSPAMLTLLSFRSEETAAKPFLQALTRAGRPRHVVRDFARPDDGGRGTRAHRSSAAG